MEESDVIWREPTFQPPFPKSAGEGFFCEFCRYQDKFCGYEDPTTNPMVFFFGLADANSIIRYLCPKFWHITGWEPDDVLGQPIRKIISEDYKVVASRRVQERVRKNESSPYITRIDLLCKSG